MWGCLTLQTHSNTPLSEQEEHHHFSMSFVQVWVSVVATGSQANASDPGASAYRQALLREFSLLPSAADKLQAPRYQRASQNCLQLLLTMGTRELRTSAIGSWENTEKCLKLHLTTSRHLPAMCGTGLILKTAGVDHGSQWDWLKPNRQC